MNQDFLIFVDFDSTLFSHQQFGNDWRQAVAREAHISYAQFTDEELAFQADPMKKYSFVEHLASHGVRHERIAEIFRGLCERGDYLYSDAAPFVRAIRALGLEPVILTRGGQLLQSSKIEPNVIRLVGNDSPKVSYIVVEIPKSEYLAANFPGCRGVLIDDVADQGLPDGFTEIHLDRRRTLTEPESHEGIYETSDLYQAVRLIKSLAIR